MAFIKITPVKFKSVMNDRLFDGYKPDEWLNSERIIAIAPVQVDNVQHLNIWYDTIPGHFAIIAVQKTEELQSNLDKLKQTKKFFKCKQADGSFSEYLVAAVTSIEPYTHRWMPGLQSGTPEDNAAIVMWLEVNGMSFPRPYYVRETVEELLTQLEN